MKKKQKEDQEDEDSDLTDLAAPKLNKKAANAKRGEILNALGKELEARLASITKGTPEYDQAAAAAKDKFRAVQSEINAEIETKMTVRGVSVAETESDRRRRVLIDLFKETGMSKVATVCSKIATIMSDPTLPKVCVFAHHHEVLDGIEQAALAGKDLEYICIDGKTKPKTQQELINAFQTNPKCRVALIGLTAAGVGVTLTASTNVIFAEMFWTPAILLQAEDRCHRIGQTAVVKVEYIHALNTFDKVLCQLVMDKFKLLGEFVEGSTITTIAITEDGKDLNPINRSGDQEVTNDGSIVDLVDSDDEIDEDELMALTNSNTLIQDIKIIDAEMHVGGLDKDGEERGPLAQRQLAISPVPPQSNNTGAGS